MGLLLLTACQDEGRPAPDVPKIVQFTVSPTDVVVGESATYSWELSGDGAMCALDIGGDGTAEYTLECAAGSQTHTFTTPGSFPATLSVTANGQSSREAAPVVTVQDGGADSAFSELEWRPTTAVAYGVAEAQAAAVGDKLYLFGGFDSRSPYGCCRPTDRAFSFDPATEIWEVLAPLPPMNGTAYGGVNHAGFTTDGKDIYLAGGYTSNAKNSQHIFGTKEVWRYNVGTDSYTRLPDLSEVRGSGVLEHYEDKLYFFGGSSERRKTDTGEHFIFDLTSGETEWRDGAPMPNPRNHLASATLNGEIYAIGGQHEHDGKLTTQADVHAYDPESDAWTQVASLPKAISHHTNSTFVVGDAL